MSEIASKVTQIIIDKFGISPEAVVPNAMFSKDLNLDSLDTVELVMQLEKEFNVTIPDEEAENIKTVGEAIAYIESRSIAL